MRSTEACAPQTEYSSNDVMRLAGVSMRQLQWWDEHKLVSPRIDGHRRVYSATELVEILVIADLRRKKLSLQKVWGIVRFVRRNYPTQRCYLVTDGRTCWMATGPDQVLEICKGIRSGLYVVCIDPTGSGGNHGFK